MDSSAEQGFCITDDYLIRKTVQLYNLRKSFFHADHSHSRQERILFTAGGAVGYHGDVIAKKRLFAAVAMIDDHLGKLFAQTMIDLINGETLSFLQGAAGRKNILHAFPPSDSYG